MRQITAEYIFDGKHLLQNKVIVIDENKVILELRELEHTHAAVEDFGATIITAGWVDLQLNGCGGVLFNASITAATLEVMHQTNLRFGTIGFLPTLISAPFSDVISALKLIQSWFKRHGNRRGVLGLHLEGPFLAAEKRGIHPAEYIIKPTFDLLAQIVPYAKIFPLKMTLAPEQFSLEQLDYLQQHGVIVALGHTNASYTQAQQAFKHGAVSVTHMFNAMSGMTGRNPGVICAVLASDCYQGLIVDLLHVDIANVKLLAKLKPTTTYLVTDAVTPAGTVSTGTVAAEIVAVREFEFAGKRLYLQDGKCVDITGTLGGACLTMNQAVANCITAGGIPLPLALQMASLVPARLLGLSHIIGRIAPGCRADLIAVNYHDYSCRVI